MEKDQSAYNYDDSAKISIDTYGMGFMISQFKWISVNNYD